MKLKEYLNKYNISVEEFACRTGLTTACLWHYFSGRRRPSKKNAIRIAMTTLGEVTIEDLRGEDAK